MTPNRRQTTVWSLSKMRVWNTAGLHIISIREESEPPLVKSGRGPTFTHSSNYTKYGTTVWRTWRPTTTVSRLVRLSWNGWGGEIVPSTLRIVYGHIQRVIFRDRFYWIERLWIARESKFRSQIPAIILKLFPPFLRTLVLITNFFVTVSPTLRGRKSIVPTCFALMKISVGL